MVIPLPRPITMRGVIDRCVLLSLRTPASGVERLVPRDLRLATRRHPTTGEVFAFWNVVLCHIERMRPTGAPAWTGVSYHHVAHRLMVETVDGGASGLYFLRSDADRRALGTLGNLVSDFRFHAATIERESREDSERWRVRTRDGGGDLLASVVDDAPSLPEGSPFGTLEEARAFLKYRPLGLAPDRAGRRVRLAEVHRDEAAWRERPIRVDAFRSAFLHALGEGGATVEIATRVEPVEYRWRLGRNILSETG